MKTKQEVIQQHYIDILNAEKFFNLKPYIDENGWCTMFDERSEKVSPTFKELGFKSDEWPKIVDTNYKEGCMVWRPKSLLGIETNNGWTRIDSEADLPTDEDELFETGLMDDSGKFTQERKRHTLKTMKWLLQRSMITHYRPVIKPEAPIY